jgi:AcrR family transcriptional regulator
MRAPKTKTDLRQEQIAEAALALISRCGMAGISVANVAKEVGVVTSAIYRHYRGKDEILDSVVDLLGQRFVGIVQAVRADESEPLERLHQLFLRHLELIRSNAGFPRVVLSDEMFSGQPRRRQKMHAILRTYLSEVALLVREGQANGRFQTDLDPDAVSVMFLGLIQPAVILWLISSGKFDLDKHADHAWRLFCTMLQPAGARSVNPPPAGARKGQSGAGK